MIERVARAICESGEADDFDALAPNSIVRAFYVQQARAAIAAMRVPTDEMIAPGLNALATGGCSAVWKAMISAALVPVPAKE